LSLDVRTKCCHWCRLCIARSYKLLDEPGFRLLANASLAFMTFWLAIIVDLEILRAFPPSRQLAFVPSLATSCSEMLIGAFEVGRSQYRRFQTPDLRSSLCALHPATTQTSANFETTIHLYVALRKSRRAGQVNTYTVIMAMQSQPSQPAQHSGRGTEFFMLVIPRRVRHPDMSFSTGEAAKSYEQAFCVA
jgi:hypothetical protein